MAKKKRLSPAAQDLLNTIGQRILDDGIDFELGRQREAEEEEERETNVWKALQAKKRDSNEDV